MVASDPGSFRDPASRVVHHGDRVIRLLDQRGLAAWEALSATRFHEEAVVSGRIIRSTPVDDPTGTAAGALEHPRLPLITYPYEWTFTMLKDAAILQLDLIDGALGAGLTVKDASPFNIQFDRGLPVFIDIGAFEPYQPGEPWIGYRQFTRQFLFPLMMRSWAGLPFQPWLRGDPEGPTASQTKAMLPWRKRIRPATLLHVGLQSKLEARMRGSAVRGELKAAGFNAEMILANVRRLRTLVASLEWDDGDPGWAGYRECTHVGRDRDRKGVFLRMALGRANPATVLDLGANDGHFSRISVEHGARAIAVDGDEAVLDRLHRDLGGAPISVVLTDLSNPAPSQGWRGVERPGLFDRTQPDLVLAYGLIHHLIYTVSVPPHSVLDWLKSFDAPVVLEFVGPTDEMVGVLTANKLEEELHPGRSEPEFRQMIGERFRIEAEDLLEGGSRVLFYLTPR